MDVCRKAMPEMALSDPWGEYPRDPRFAVPNQGLSLSMFTDRVLSNDVGIVEYSQP